MALTNCCNGLHGMLSKMLHVNPKKFAYCFFVTARTHSLVECNINVGIA